MSLVTMKRLSVIVPKPQRRAVIRQLYRLGCVELEKQETPPEALTLQPESTHAEQDRQTLEQALFILSRVAPAKKSMLAPRREVGEARLFDGERAKEAVSRAEELLGLWERHENAKARISRLRTQSQSLEPWKDMDAPLAFSGTAHTDFCCGVMPAQTALAAAQTALAALPAVLTPVGADKEQHYCTLLCHSEAAEAAAEALKPFGFSRMSFHEEGEPRIELAALVRQTEQAEQEIAETEREIAALAAHRPLLEDASDALGREAGCDRVLSESPCTEQTVFLLGWLPKKAETVVGEALEKLGCAWECRDPEEGEEPPTATENGPIAAPFESITSMYGTPTYGSIVDPNPSMAPFYAIFFGFMMCDAAYGILMFLGCLIALKKMKPQGGMKSLLTVFMYCGVTTFIAGALTGGWFADVIPAFTGTFLSHPVTIKPLWFDPLKDPMTMLILSMVMGVIQILVGMGLSAYRQIKSGDWLGAIYDTGSWYLIFLGLGFFAAGKLGALPAILGTLGPWIALVGALLVVCFSARDSKGVGRFGSGLYNLYGISSYVSDIFSYSRIMALGLSGAVVGQVVNKMGIMGGKTVFGFLLFVFAFVVGHAFNLSVNLLGAYVHSCRLQYIEFFGKFFANGGRAFKPLFHTTNYVTIMKEDN